MTAFMNEKVFFLIYNTLARKSFSEICHVFLNVAIIAPNAAFPHSSFKESNRHCLSE